MTRIKAAALIGFALISLLAIATTSAFAIAGEGEVSNKEEKALVKNKSTATNGKTIFETTGGTKASCGGGKTSGIMVNLNEGEQTTTFTGCESAGLKCNSEGQAAGEVQIKLTLKITTDKESDKGYFLYSVPESSGSFKCGGIVSIHIKGSFLVELGSAQEHKLKTKDAFTAEQSKGSQKPTEYENEKGEKVKDSLEIESAKKTEKAGTSGTAEVTFEEEAEVLGFERFRFVNKAKELMIGKKFTSSGGISMLKAGTMTIECRKNKGTGEVIGPSSLGNFVITLEGCEETSKKCKVKSPGATNADEIVTRKLVGELGEIGGFVSDDLGLDIDPEGTEGIAKVEGPCITMTTLESGAIGEITPENTVGLTLEQVYEQSGGKQKYMSFEESGSGGIVDSGDHFVIFGVEAAFVNRMTLTFEEQLEIHAP